MRHVQEGILVGQGVFFLLGVGFLVYSTGRIGAAYNKADDKNQQAKARGEKVAGGMDMTKQVFNFVGYDWIFLIYCCIFIVSIIYDIVALSIGSADSSACYARIGNICSFVVHFVLRLLLCLMTVCIMCQVQCSENPLCMPCLSVLTCGMINPEKRRKMRQRRQELREARNASSTWMSKQPQQNQNLDNSSQPINGGPYPGQVQNQPPAYNPGTTAQPGYNPHNQG